MENEGLLLYCFSKVFFQVFCKEVHRFLGKDSGAWIMVEKTRILSRPKGNWTTITMKIMKSLSGIQNKDFFSISIPFH